ncbi:MAG: hypothetical protein OXH90_05015 [Paracoccaceae bacterium]|nr:hypothetical protein [Paracoccaceae bacterium]MDE2917029.1 hypothetical protein [Paracoccaceae bacterium]
MFSESGEIDDHFGVFRKQLAIHDYHGVFWFLGNAISMRKMT